MTSRRMKEAREWLLGAYAAGRPHDPGRTRPNIAYRRARLWHRLPPRLSARALRCMQVAAVERFGDPVAPHEVLADRGRESRGIDPRVPGGLESDVTVMWGRSEKDAADLPAHAAACAPVSEHKTLLTLRADIGEFGTPELPPISTGHSA